MDTLTITLTNTRAIDGLVYEANRGGKSVEDYALQLMETQGLRSADDNRIGVITSALFIKGFTASEYAEILNACNTVEVPVPVDPENPTEAEISAITQATTTNSIAVAVSSLVDQLTESPNIALDDSRLRPGLTLLVSIGLLDAGRIDTLLSYTRPDQEF
jgi:hypothetical protein